MKKPLIESEQEKRDNRAAVVQLAVEIAAELPMIFSHALKAIWPTAQPMRPVTIGELDMATRALGLRLVACRGGFVARRR